MFIDQETLKRVNIYAPYKGRSKLDTPEIRAELGVIEIPDPARGNDEIEYTQELDDAPYIVVTPKSPEQLERQQADKDSRNAQQHLVATDYLFHADRHAALLKDEPEREADLRNSRELAREVLRAYKVKYPQA